MITLVKPNYEESEAIELYAVNENNYGTNDAPQCDPNGDVKNCAC